MGKPRGPPSSSLTPRSEEAVTEIQRKLVNLPDDSATRRAMVSAIAEEDLPSLIELVASETREGAVGPSASKEVLRRLGDAVLLELVLELLRQGLTHLLLPPHQLRRTYNDTTANLGEGDFTPSSIGGSEAERPRRAA